jgi:hypothetical protein
MSELSEVVSVLKEIKNKLSRELSPWEDKTMASMILKELGQVNYYLSLMDGRLKKNEDELGQVNYYLRLMDGRLKEIKDKLD